MSHENLVLTNEGCEGNIASAALRIFFTLFTGLKVKTSHQLKLQRCYFVPGDAGNRTGVGRWGPWNKRNHL